jgi:hypothetical protein
MAFTRFINLNDGTEVTKISELLAPVESNFGDDGESLHLKNTVYYFDETKKLQFTSTKTFSGAFTIGLAFAPSRNFRLGKLLGLENSDSYLSIGKGTTFGSIAIKLAGKTVKNANLDFESEGSNVKYKEIKFIPYELNVLYIIRSAANVISVRDFHGDLIILIPADANTSGNLSMNRIGGDSLDNFEGYIGDILIEPKELTKTEMQRISKIWFDKYVVSEYLDTYSE